MTVDTRRSLVNYFWNLLTNDSILVAAMGGTVRCYYSEGEADAEFPYLVHRLSIRSQSGVYPMQSGTYYLDIWSQSDNIAELTAIRERVMQLLDQLDFSTDDVKMVTVDFASDDDSVEPEQRIWHLPIIFELDFRRDSEAIAIEGR